MERSSHRQARINTGIRHPLATEWFRLSGLAGLLPIAVLAPVWYLRRMNLLLIIIVLFLLLGGGGFYIGGPVIGGSGLGLVLLICLVIFIMGGFRTKT